MAPIAASFDLSTAFLDQPKTLAYGLVRGAGNLILQQELTDKTRVSFYMLGEGPWDSILRLWINNKLVTLPSSSTVHFHPGPDGEIGNGLAAVSTGGDQHVDQFFTLIPGGLSPITFSRFAWLALKTAPDPGAPSAQLTVLADYQAMQVRQFDSSGNQTAFAWTQNPAWWICDFLIRKFVLREAKVNQPLVAAELARFDWAAFSAAAAYYDASIGVVPAFVQSAQTQAFSALAYPSNNVAGNLLVACGRFTAGSGTPTIADSKGNAWTLVHSIVNTNSIDMFWYAANCAAGPNSVTITANGRSFCTAVIAEYSGVATVSPLDQQAIANSGASSATAVSPTITPTNSNDLLICWCANETANSLTGTAGTGFALRQNSNGNVFLEDEDITGLGSVSGSIGLSSSVNWTAGIVAFKAGGTGGGAKRFSDGGVVYANSSDTANKALEQMLMMCRSYLLERNGKLSLYADQPRSSIFTFTTDNVAPKTFKAYKTNLRAATNRLTPTFRDLNIASGSSDDATRFAIASDPQLNHEAHQRAVGARGAGLSVLPKVTELVLDLGVNTPERVWRILDAMLVRQLGDDVDANSVYNAPFAAEWTGYEDSLAVEPGDVVTIDPSLSEEFGGKLFEVLEPTYAPDGSIDYIGLEYMPNAFPDEAPAQQALQAPVPGTGLNPAASVVDGSGNLLVPLDTGVQDGTSFARTVASDLTSNRLDFSKGLLNKQLDNIPDGTSYARPLSTRISAGKPLIDFSEGIHLNKNLDNVADGSSFIRLAGTHAAGNVSYNFRGSWASATSYVVGDEVAYQGTYWLCIIANSSSAPTFSNANWQSAGINIQVQSDAAGQTTNPSVTVLTVPSTGFYIVAVNLYVSKTSVGTCALTPTASWTQNGQAVSITGPVATATTATIGASTFMALVYADSATGIVFSTTGTFGGGATLDYHVRVIGPV